MNELIFLVNTERVKTIWGLTVFFLIKKYKQNNCNNVDSKELDRDIATIREISISDKLVYKAKIMLSTDWTVVIQKESIIMIMLYALNKKVKL